MRKEKSGGKKKSGENPTKVGIKKKGVQKKEGVKKIGKEKRESTGKKCVKKIGKEKSGGKKKYG